MTSAPNGWTRFVMKSKFGAGRDFNVTDVDDNKVYLVDGKLGATPKAEIQDASGVTRFKVRGKLLGFPKEMVISDSTGAEVASMKAKMFSPIKSKVKMNFADGTHWAIEGSLIEKNYRIDRDAGPVAEISQKWVTVLDSYSLDVIDGVDPAMVLAVVWAIDRWVERD